MNLWDQRAPEVSTRSIEKEAQASVELKPQRSETQRLVSQAEADARISFTPGLAALLRVGRVAVSVLSFCDNLPTSLSDAMLGVSRANTGFPSFDKKVA